MRLFTGIGLPEEMTGKLEGLIRELKPAAKVRWSPAANLHITTKFIGEWPEERLEELKGALRGVERRGALEIGVRGLGWFPNPHAPRIFWVSVDGGEGLRTLAAGTEEALTALGIAREKRAYTPHLTLARVGPGTDLRELRRRVAELPGQDWGRFRAESFSLYRSEPGAGGSVYTALERFAL
jgi:2'-5' RNA ligase